MNGDPVLAFREDERTTLAALADVLIPPAPGCASASEAGVAAAGLDRVLAVRPDLGPDLARVLHAARERDPSAFVAGLAGQDPRGYAVLTELVAAAYFINPGVRAAIRYDGQRPRAIDPRPEWLDDGLLQRVIDRGPIYRPTP